MPAIQSQRCALEADLTCVNSRDVQAVLKASLAGAAGDGAKNVAICEMVAKYAKTGATAEQQAALTQALQNTGTTGKVPIADLAVIAAAEKAIHPHSHYGPATGTYIDNVLAASKRGPEGDADKNVAICEMVANYKRHHATDAECAALTAALQGSGTTGRFNPDDLAVINKAQEKINGNASRYISGSPEFVSEYAATGRI